MFGGGGGRGGMGYLLRHGDEQARPQVSGALLRRVLGYARPYVGRIVLLLTSICATIGLGLLTPLIVRDLIDTALPAKDAARLNLLAAGLIAIPVAGAVIRIWQRKLDATIGSGIILDLRTALYSHLQRMSMRFFTSNKTGELMSRLNSDVIGAQSAVTNTLVDVTTNLIQVAGTLAIMLALEWRLTVLGLAVLPIFLLLGRRFGKALREVSRQSMERNARMNAIMSETLNISGLILVKLFGRRQEEQRRFGEQAEGVRHLAIRQAVIGSRFFVLMGIATAVGTAGIYLVGGHLHIRGGLTIGTVVAFSTYLAQLYGPLRSLSNVAVVVAQSLVSFERVFEVLDLPVDIEESPHAHRLERAEGRIEFRDVSFRYERDEQLLLTEARRAARVEDMAFTATGGEPGPVGQASRVGQPAGRRPAGSGTGAGWQGPRGARPARPGAAAEPPLAAQHHQARERAPGRRSVRSPSAPSHQAREWALKDVSFAVEPGQSAAVVGPSGAGKTTLSYLIPRLYDPTHGRIVLDGHDTRELTMESLAAQIGMVTQEPYLFHDSVRANLLYAAPGADEARITGACRAANIHDFIAALPAGYDTVVGERGYRLSGGEKQRLAIARVILKDPRVLILDEATSHLDTRSEALIQEALSRVVTGRTSIIIAHRLSTILAADTILVLDRGRVVERGTHAELNAAGGLYQRLYETQFRE